MTFQLVVGCSSCSQRDMLARQPQQLPAVALRCSDSITGTPRVHLPQRQPRRSLLTEQHGSSNSNKFPTRGKACSGIRACNGRRSNTTSRCGARATEDPGAGAGELQEADASAGVDVAVIVPGFLYGASSFEQVLPFVISNGTSLWTMGPASPSMRGLS